MITKCEVCSKDIVSDKGKIYCSQGCRQKAYDQRRIDTAIAEEKERLRKEFPIRVSVEVNKVLDKRVKEEIRKYDALVRKGIPPIIGDDNPDSQEVDYGETVIDLDA